MLYHTICRIICHIFILLDRLLVRGHAGSEHPLSQTIKRKTLRVGVPTQFETLFVTLGVGAPT